MRGVPGEIRNIAVFGRSTVSTQPYLGTRDPRQIEARQQVLPIVPGSPRAGEAFYAGFILQTCLPRPVWLSAL